MPQPQVQQLQMYHSPRWLLLTEWHEPGVGGAAKSGQSLLTSLCPDPR